jgi:hypothetical protein
MKLFLLLKITLHLNGFLVTMKTISVPTIPVSVSFSFISWFPVTEIEKFRFGFRFYFAFAGLYQILVEKSYALLEDSFYKVSDAIRRYFLKRYRYSGQITLKKLWI